MKKHPFVKLLSFLIIIGSFSTTAHAQTSPSTSMLATVDLVYYHKHDSSSYCVKNDKNSTSTQECIGSGGTLNYSTDSTYILKPLPIEERAFYQGSGDEYFDRTDNALTSPRYGSESKTNIQHYAICLESHTDCKEGGFQKFTDKNGTVETKIYTPPVIPKSYVKGGGSYSWTNSTGSNYHTDYSIQEDSRAQLMIFQKASTTVSGTYRTLLKVSANSIVLNKTTNAFEYPTIPCNKLSVAGTRVSSDCQVAVDLYYSKGWPVTKDVTVSSSFSYYKYNVDVAQSSYLVSQSVAVTTNPNSVPKTTTPYDDFLASIFSAVQSLFSDKK